MQHEILLWKKAHLRTKQWRHSSLIVDSSSLGPRHTRHFCTHYLDKKIQIFCDIRHFLATDFYWLTKVSSLKNFYYILKRAYLAYNIHGPKIYFHRNIVCKNVSCEVGLCRSMSDDPIASFQVDLISADSSGLSVRKLLGWSDYNSAVQPIHYMCRAGLFPNISKL